VVLSPLRYEFLFRYRFAVVTTFTALHFSTSFCLSVFTPRFTRCCCIPPAVCDILLPFMRFTHTCRIGDVCHRFLDCVRRQIV